ncbi:AMP-dependent synthetase/ligase [Trinorchestia longiramus]|nr:AMP-dependent synthetase/ligase [Trinorchestia longiramus]
MLVVYSPLEATARQAMAIIKKDIPMVAIGPSEATGLPNVVDIVQDTTINFAEPVQRTSLALNQPLTLPHFPTSYFAPFLTSYFAPFLTSYFASFLTFYFAPFPTSYFAPFLTSYFSPFLTSYFAPFLTSYFAPFLTSYFASFLTSYFTPLPTSPPSPSPQLTGEERMALLYSSGTTGKAKGVSIHHSAGVINLDMMTHPKYYMGNMSTGTRILNMDNMSTGTRILNMDNMSTVYGMTECLLTHQDPLGETRLGFTGQIYPGLEGKVVDTETGKTLPPTQMGELCIRGPTVGAVVNTLFQSRSTLCVNTLRVCTT